MNLRWEPTPNPSKEGNRRTGPLLLFPSLEGLGVGLREQKPSAGSCLNARSNSRRGYPETRTPCRLKAELQAFRRLNPESARTSDLLRHYE
jgi:hypothetical protein